ncbi:ABC transporter permease [Thermogladius sp. 4427co]|uniref:ABC transporter permease n=1 Tax=Thermogladius sp. 4427co TaxID=3450718 RepID=UPI003F79B9AB
MVVSLNYVFKRVFYSTLIVLGIIIVTYYLIILSPGDPAVRWAGNPRGPGADKAIEIARRELNLDKPFYIQVVLFIMNIFTGNIGYSISTKSPVLPTIWSHMSSTLELLIVAYLIGIPVGVFMGVYSSLNRGSFRGDSIDVFGFILANTPSFWIGIGVFILLAEFLGVSSYGRINARLAASLGFHPITGFYLIDTLLEGEPILFLDVLKRLIPPALVVSVYPIGVGIRVVRALMAEALNEDYVRQAVALGLKRNTIVWGYAFRGTIPALTQVFGLAFAYSLVDAMIVEYIFGREGLGNLLVNSIVSNDFKLAVSILIVVGVFYIIVNTLADIIQSIIDPRIRL